MNNIIQDFLIISILLIIYNPSFGQTNENDKIDFIDKRDGKKYELLEVKKLIWFAQDLRLETKTSYKLIQQNGESKLFYTNEQLDSLCPAPFRIPSAKEWEEAITELYGVRKTVYKKVKKNKATIFKLEMDSSFVSNQKLNIQNTGWIEGGDYVAEGATTYWTNERGKLNYHLHFGEKLFSEHTHKKSIDGKKKKRRQFLVRCVCKKTKFNK